MNELMIEEAQRCQDGITVSTLTSWRNVSIVNKIWSSVEAKSKPSEFLEDDTFVRPVVPVLVRLYPSITGSHNCNIHQSRQKENDDWGVTYRKGYKAAGTKHR